MVQISNIVLVATLAVPVLSIPLHNRQIEVENDIEARTVKSGGVFRKLGHVLSGVSTAAGLAALIPAATSQPPAQAREFDENLEARVVKSSQAFHKIGSVLSGVSTAAGLAALIPAAQMQQLSTALGIPAPQAPQARELTDEDLEIVLRELSEYYDQLD